MLHIGKIGSELAFPRDCVPAQDLREAAEARPDVMPPPFVLRHEHHIPHKLRAGADERHVPFDDIGKLK